MAEIPLKRRNSSIQPTNQLVPSPFVNKMNRTIFVMFKFIFIRSLPIQKGMVAQLPSAAHVTSDVLSCWPDTALLTDTRGYGGPVPVRGTCDRWRVDTLTYWHTKVRWPSYRPQHMWPLTCCHADLPTHEGTVAQLPSAVHVTSDMLSRWPVLTDTWGYGGPVTVRSTRGLWHVVTLTGTYTNTRRYGGPVTARSTCDLWHVVTLTGTYRHTKVRWSSYRLQHIWPLTFCHADRKWRTHCCMCMSCCHQYWHPSPCALHPGHLEDFHMLLKREQNNNASKSSELFQNIITFLLDSNLIFDLNE